MEPNILNLDGRTLKIKDLVGFLEGEKTKTSLGPDALGRVKRANDFLLAAVAANSRVTYGINTGFGPMANYILAHGQIEQLQKNLILSHAVGLGPELPQEFVLTAMIVRLNTLLVGHSGVSPQLVETLQTLINNRVVPIVPEHGAVGTSGDLVQLAHIALALLGKGEAYHKGHKQKVSTIFKQLRLKPYKLRPKEGLALINGTSMMSAIAANVCHRASRLFELVLANGCFALELVRAYDDSFGETLNRLRPHPGQLAVAAAIRTTLKDSKLIRDRKGLHQQANHGQEINKIDETVQEIYSLRCQTQILGPAYETILHVRQTVETEINSATDNPLVDWQKQQFLHGGNFHGDYISVAMDQLKMSLVKLTILSERQLNYFLNDKINKIFPPFLNLKTPGLTLGLQGLQFVATSTTAHSQTLAFPMNVHSISTNGDNQDVVSMGTDSALIAAEVLDNAYIVAAIESLALCQAADYLKVSGKLSSAAKKLYREVRAIVPPVIEDRYLQPELAKLVTRLKNGEKISLLNNF